MQEDFRLRTHEYSPNPNPLGNRYNNPIEAWSYLTSLSQLQHPGLLACNIQVVFSECFICKTINLRDKNFERFRTLRVIFPAASSQDGVTWGQPPRRGVASIKISCLNICQDSYYCDDCFELGTGYTLKASVSLLQPLPSVVSVSLGNAFSRPRSGQPHPLLGPKYGEYPLDRLMRCSFDVANHDRNEIFQLVGLVLYIGKDGKVGDSKYLPWKTGLQHFVKVSIERHFKAPSVALSETESLFGTPSHPNRVLYCDDLAEQEIVVNTWDALLLLVGTPGTSNILDHAVPPSEFVERIAYAFYERSSTSRLQPNAQQLLAIQAILDGGQASLTDAHVRLFQDYATPAQSRELLSRPLQILSTISGVAGIAEPQTSSVSHSSVSYSYPPSSSSSSTFLSSSFFS